MKETVIATYIRPDTYKGHSRINHYHWATKVCCSVYDYTEERNMGIMINNVPCPDTYHICVYNYKNDVIARYVYNNRDEANTAFIAIKKNTTGLIKV